MALQTKLKNNCKHQRLLEIKTPVYNQYTGDESVDIRWEWEDTFTDIDLHRFKCTQCGEIGYYSEAAENYYTKGINNPMLGPGTEDIL
jgi:hypothetical protein